MVVSPTNKKISSRHWKTKEKVINLRKKGLSYNEIIKIIPVSKSSVSLWCRNIQLNNDQRKLIDNKRNYLSGIKAIQNKFWNLRSKSFNDGRDMINKLTKNERFVAGLMLYWAEGTKAKSAAISNSDPRLIKFMITWFKEFFAIFPKNFHIHMHIHSGHDENKLKLFWSKLTGVPLQNFRKSFIKEEGSGYKKNILYNGTIKIIVVGKGSTYLLFKILWCIAGFLEKALFKKESIESWIDKLPYAI